MEIEIKDLEHIREAAKQFISQIGDHRVFAFYGSMGAGKTTFIKAICEELGVTDVVTSPTFAIVNEYTCDTSLTSHPSPLTSHPSPLTSHPSPLKYPYTYLYNISNRLSQQFYGAKELSAYELKGGDGPIMQCRHCIRYALGYCVRHGGQRPTWHEPLSLVLGDGRRFRLEFDCKNCQMNVYAP